MIQHKSLQESLGQMLSYYRVAQEKFCPWHEQVFGFPKSLSPVHVDALELGLVSYIFKTGLPKKDFAQDTNSWSAFINPIVLSP